MDDESDLAGAWLDAQGRLPTGWQLDSLQCASTGLGEAERSDDWVAVAIGPGGAERRARAADPIAALDALVRDRDPG
jgi:hypothetical protein